MFKLSEKNKCNLNNAQFETNKTENNLRSHKS